jgi:phosphoribosylaminoimidazole (AIR) synthetase
MLEPSGFGVKIDDPIDPPRIMLHVQELRNFDDRQAYGKWHMGPGMVIASPEPESVLEVAEEHGIDAKVIGTVTDEPGIRIRNRAARRREHWLSF